MFTKLKQCSWIKIEVSQSRSTQLFQGLHEACDEAALPYYTEAWLVKHSEKAGMPFRTISIQGDPTVQLLAFLLNVDCKWTACELAAEV